MFMLLLLVVTTVFVNLLSHVKYGRAIVLINKCCRSHVVDGPNFTNLPRHVVGEGLAELDDGELGGDARVDARRGLPDVEPDGEAGQQAQHRVAPVDQEHEQQLDQKLRRKHLFLSHSANGPLAHSPRPG